MEVSSVIPGLSYAPYWPQDISLNLPNFQPMELHGSDVVGSYKWMWMSVLGSTLEASPHEEQYPSCYAMLGELFYPAHNHQLQTFLRLLHFTKLCLKLLQYMHQ